MKNCPRCGHLVPSDAKYCKNCGYKFDALFHVTNPQSFHSAGSTIKYYHRNNQNSRGHKNHFTKASRQEKADEKSFKENEKATSEANRQPTPHHHHIFHIVSLVVILLILIGGGYYGNKALQHHQMESATANDVDKQLHGKDGTFANKITYNPNKNIAYLYVSSTGASILDQAKVGRFQYQIAQQEGSINRTSPDSFEPSTANDNENISNVIHNQQRSIRKTNPHFKIKLINHQDSDESIPENTNQAPTDNEWIDSKQDATRILSHNHKFAYHYMFNRERNLVTVIIHPHMAKKLGVIKYCRRHHINHAIEPYVPVTDTSDDGRLANSPIPQDVTSEIYRICKKSHNFGLRIRLVVKTPKLHTVNKK